jgi:ribosomal protein S18 acetylase RimI-like enzyme
MTPAFEIDVPGYAVQSEARGGQVASTALRSMRICFSSRGEPFLPTAAQAEFRSIPDGKSLGDKLMFGLINPQGRIAGLLEAVQHYPDETTWWLGLLMLAPELRGQGVGREVLRGFSEYVRLRGGKAIMLGVVEENRRAYLFWQKMGFEVVRKTEPRPFGKKMQPVT